MLVGPIPEYILEKYLILKEQHKYIENELEQIKKMIYDFGSFSTENYVCSITQQERTTIKPLKDCINVFGLDLIVENELLNKTKYKIISVSKRENT